MKRCIVCDRPLSSTRAKKHDRCGGCGDHLHVGDLSHPLFHEPFIPVDFDGRVSLGVELLGGPR